jgi:Zn-dependent protease
MDWWIRVAGIPVRLSVWFLLTSILIAPKEAKSHPGLGVSWILIVFVGVLLHELGHALTARAFGQTPVISFQAFGGLTSWNPTGEMGAGKRLLISAAGPMVGIAIGLLVAVVMVVTTAKGSMPRTVLSYVVWVNLGWGVLNLFPILPLDGGKIMGSLFDLMAPSKGMTVAHIVSIVLAVGLGILAIVGGAPIAAILCALFVYVNVQALRGPRSEAPPPSEPPGPDSRPPLPTGP